MRLFVVLLMMAGSSAAIADDADINASPKNSAVSSTNGLPCSVSNDYYGRVADTSNFRIHWSVSEQSLRELAEQCECLAAKSKEHWLTKEQAQTWAPRCEVFVHPNVMEYVRFLGRGSEQTSGCATLQLDHGRVVLRRIDLRADAPDWKTESLPHELTHVVLADRFSTRRIAPWADEGIAMLSESREKLAMRLGELRRVARQGTTYSMQDLMNVTTSPLPAFRPAFYGQSVALVSYLLEFGTRGQLLDFVETSQAKGTQAALRDVYGMAMANGLERGMRDYISTDRLVRKSGDPIVPVSLQTRTPSKNTSLMD